MQSIIEALYNGEIFPAEQAVLNDSRYREYSKKQAQTADKLSSSMTAEQKNTL